MSEEHPITFRLKAYNAWRRGNDVPQPDPKTIGEDIDSICDIAKRLERERDEERALADRLAEALTPMAWLAGIKTPNSAEEVLAAWKEARGE